MARKNSSKIKTQTYSLGKWDSIVFWASLALAGLLLWLTGSIINKCECLNPVVFICISLIGVIGIGFLIFAFYTKSLGKRSIEVGPTGIAKIDKHGTRTFIGWDEIADFSSKNSMGVLNLCLSDLSGKRKIRIGGFEQSPVVIERVFAEFVKRMPTLLPQNFKWFPARSLTITRKEVQLRNIFKTEILEWSEIDRLDLGNMMSFLWPVLFLKITAKDKQVYRVHGRKVIRVYLVLRKGLQNQKSYRPTFLPDQKIPFGTVALYGFLLGILWINFHNSAFMFIPLGMRNYKFWLWILSLVLLFCLVLKLAGRERLLPQTPFQSPICKILITFALSLFTMTVGGILTWALWFHFGQKALEKAKMDVVAAGYSFEMPKNAAHVPEKENSATYLKMAAEAKSVGSLQFNGGNNPLWKKEFFNKKNEGDFLVDFQIHAREGTLTPVEILYARKLIRMHADILQLLDTAYDKQKVDWGMDFTISPSYDIKIPNTGPTLNFSRLLLCQAVVQAKDKQIEKAFRSIKTGLFMGEAEGEKRFSIDVLIHESICKVMLDAMRAIEPLVDPRMEEKELLPFLNPQELNDRFMKSIQMQAFATKEGWYKKFSNADFKPSNMLDAATYYEAQIQKLNAFKLPYSEVKKAWDKADQDYQSNGWLDGLIWDETNFPGLYRLDETVAYCRLAHAAVEARLFHAKNKRWPDAVWELDKKNWDDYLDPFTDHYNLRIMRYGNGILIYSVGPKGQDNQGMAIDLKNNYYPYNFGWILGK